jgi:hypothetical protein
MRFLPTTSNSSFAVEDFFIMLAAVVLPGIAFLVAWALFFKNKRRRKRRRRHDIRSSNPTLAHTGGLPPVRKPENFTDQPKS